MSEILNSFFELFFIVCYLGLGIIAAWFIWTDRKIIKLSKPSALSWMILCIGMPLLVPVYIFYRQNKLL